LHGRSIHVVITSRAPFFRKPHAAGYVNWEPRKHPYIPYHVRLHQRINIGCFSKLFHPYPMIGTFLPTATLLAVLVSTAYGDVAPPERRNGLDFLNVCAEISSAISAQSEVFYPGELLNDDSRIILRPLEIPVRMITIFITGQGLARPFRRAPSSPEQQKTLERLYASIFLFFFFVGLMIDAQAANFGPNAYSIRSKSALFCLGLVFSLSIGQKRWSYWQSWLLLFERRFDCHVSIQ